MSMLMHRFKSHYFRKVSMKLAEKRENEKNFHVIQLVQLEFKKKKMPFA